MRFYLAHITPVCFCMILGSVCFSFSLSAQSPKAYNRSLKLMGSHFELTAVALNEAIAWQALEAGITEIQRIEALISSWDEQSETSAVNRAAGLDSVPISQELYDLIYRCLKVSQLTDGAFDISFAGSQELWQFDKGVHPLPHPEQIEASVRLINWQNIELSADPAQVFLRQAGMRIGFGAIGKGYAANRARQVMQGYQLSGGMVNAGGDLTAWGKPPGGGSWRVGIADPKARDEVFSWLEIEDGAVVTSGNYEKYFSWQDTVYGHIIDPRSGYPAIGLQSVSIICPDAELADALATSVYVLGPTEGMALIDRLKGVECLMVTHQGTLLRSKHLHLNPYDSQHIPHSPTSEPIIGAQP